MLRDSIITVDSLFVIVNVLKRAMIMDAESTLSIVNLLQMILNDSMEFSITVIGRCFWN